MNSRHAVISDSQWELRTPFMIDSTDKAGRPFNDHNLMTEGIFYRYMAGTHWRDLPEQFGYWKLV